MHSFEASLQKTFSLQWNFDSISFPIIWYQAISGSCEAVRTWDSFRPLPRYIPNLIIFSISSNDCWNSTLCGVEGLTHILEIDIFAYERVYWHAIRCHMSQLWLDKDFCSENLSFWACGSMYENTVIVIHYYRVDLFCLMFTHPGARVKDLLVLGLASSGDPWNLNVWVVI